MLQWGPSYPFVVHVPDSPHEVVVADGGAGSNDDDSGHHRTRPLEEGVVDQSAVPGGGGGGGGGLAPIELQHKGWAKRTRWKSRAARWIARVQPRKGREKAMSAPSCALLLQPALDPCWRRHDSEQKRIQEVVGERCMGVGGYAGEASRELFDQTQSERGAPLPANPQSGLQRSLLENRMDVSVSARSRWTHLRLSRSHGGTHRGLAVCSSPQPDSRGWHQTRPD